MIELKPDKFLIEFYDHDLAKFLSDSKNSGLKQAFEKAACASVARHMDTVLVYADNKESAPAIKAALQEMAAELKTIPEDRFMSIVKKMAKVP